MAGEADGSSHRRKRGGQSHSSEPAAKRPAVQAGPGPASTGLKAVQQELQQLYRAYAVLCQAPHEQGAAKEQHYQALLDGAKGSAGARALAARLIGKFVESFPRKAEAAVAALQSLCDTPAASDSATQAWREGTRQDALRGLGAACAVLARAQPTSYVPVTKAVELLCRRLGKGRRHTEPTSSQQNGSHKPSPSEADCARQSLADIFAVTPRTVLSVCLKALRQRDTDIYSGAKRLLSDALLAAQPCSQAADGTANGAVAPCLAAAVFTKRPDLHDWMRNAVDTFWREAPLATSKEVRKLLDQLMAQLQQKAALPQLPAPLSSPSHQGAAQTVPASSSLAQPAANRQLSPGHLPHPGSTGGARPSPVTPALVNGTKAAHEARLSTEQEAAAAELRRRQASGAQAGPSGAVRSQAPPPALAAPANQAPQAACLRPEDDIHPATCALRFTNLPHNVSPPALQRECARFSSVEYVVPGEPGMAEVVFNTLRHAVMCYEAMCGQAPWGGRPLLVQFCPHEPQAPGSSGRRDEVRRPQREHLWVGGVASREGIAEVMRTLAAARLPAPDVQLRVAGCHPGVLLQYVAREDLQRAQEALRARIAGPPAAVPPAVPPAASASASGSLPPAPSAPSMSGSPRSDALPQFACRTLWVGKVHSDVREEELVGAFKKASGGDIAGWKLLRASNCAFFDFQTVEGANRARLALDGHRFAGWPIRIEFKDEKQFWSRPGSAPRRDAPPSPGLHTPLHASPGLAGSASSRGAVPAQPASTPAQPAAPLPTGGSLPQPSAARASRFDSGPRPSPADAPAGSTLRPSRFSAGGASSLAAGEGMRTGPLPPAPAGRLSRFADTPAGQRDGAQPAVPPATNTGSVTSRRAFSDRPPGVSQPWQQAGSGSPAPPLPLEPPPVAGPPPPPATLPRLPQQAQTAAAGWTEVLPGAPAARAAQPAAAPRSSKRTAAVASWVGTLLKSGVVVCSLLCKDSPQPGGAGRLAREPLAWPQNLDVRHRLPIDQVMQHAAGGGAGLRWAARRLVAPPGGQHQTMLRDFRKYLEQKHRAGFVELGEADPEVGARKLYLVPPSPAVAAGLGLAWEPHECLFALIVPAQAQPR